MNASMRRGWSVLLVAILFQAISVGTIYYGFTFWIGPWQREFGGGRASLLWAPTCLTIVMGVLSPFVGRALDRLPIRALVCAGAVLQALGFALIARAGAVWQIVIIYATLLAGGLVLSGPLVAQTLAVRQFEAHKGLAVGLVVTGVPVGALVLPHLIAALATAFDWRTAHGILAMLVIAIVAPPAWLIIRDIPQESAGEIQRSSDSADTAGSFPIWTVRSILVQRVFWVSGIALVILGMIVTAIPPNLAPFAEDVGILVQRVPLLLSAYACALIFSNVAFGFLADRWHGRYVYGLAALLLSLCLMLMLGAPAYTTLLISCVLLGLAEGCIHPLMGIVLSRHFGTHAYGRVAGVMSFFLVGSAMLGALLMGWVRDRSGSYDLALITALLSLIPAIVLILWLPRASERRAYERSVAND